MTEEQNYPREVKKDFTQNVEKAAKWVKRKKVQRVKKHSRTSPEIQLKELNEKLKNTLPDQQINWTKRKPKHKQNHLEKLRNKNNQTN